MNLDLLHLLARVAPALSSTLVATIWQDLLLVAAVALYLRLVPRLSAEARYTAWAMLLPVLLLLPLLGLALRRGVPAITPSTSIVAPVLNLDARWSLAIAGLWAVLSLVRATRLAHSAVLLHAIARNSIPLAVSHDLHHAVTTSLTTNHQRRATVCTTDSPAITQPSVVGFFSPRILIPQTMAATLTPTDLRQIVLHELEHLRRRDDWMNLAQKISLVFFPLNPALFLVERRLCHERELACDNGVLRSTAAPKLYARCLVHLAEQRLLFRQMPLALGAWARRSQLAQRIDYILHPTSTTSTSTPLALLAGGLVAGLLALSQAPQLVSFTPVSAPAQVADTAGLTSGHGRSSSLRPVVFHPNAEPHMTLLKASMPAPSQSTIPARTNSRKHISKRVATPRERSIVQLPSRALLGQRVVLTYGDQPRLFFTYAAVPTPDGWLVFQL